MYEAIRLEARTDLCGNVGRAAAIPDLSLRVKRARPSYKRKFAMQKWLILILVIALAGSQGVCASTGNASRPAVKQTDDLWGKHALITNSAEGRDLGENILSSIREYSEAATTLPISSGHNGPNDMVEASDGQVTTGTPQSPPKQPHHKHHLRNALIVFGACFAMALVIAVASK